MSVNFGDVFDTIASAIEPEAAAVICDGVITSWSQLDHRSTALARYLIERELAPGAKVSLYMRNGPDYITAFVGALKARLAPVNINYRYGPDEIAYLLDNSDSEALIFDGEFAETVDRACAGRSLKALVSARNQTAGADFLDDIHAREDDSPIELRRDPEDLFLLYTGGTTGMPKGVMWPSSSLWGTLSASRAVRPEDPPPMTLAALDAQIRSGEGRVRYHIAPPLMHGTGLFAALSVLSRGGSIVCSARPSFDPESTVAELELWKCDGVVIVGDAFARPLLDVLLRNPGRFDVSHMKMVVSSGMMWSPEVKLGLLDFMPDATLSDGLGASESAGIAYSVVTKDAPPSEARFNLANAIVLRPDDLKPVTPGSGETGIIAKCGDLPLGYYKDPERTARTYVTIGGVRYILGGDHALVEADGSIRLLGRGSHCINTAGEKVYPEEVEEALKTHPLVTDALVFGVADDRFGQSVAAVVAVSDAVTEAELISHVRIRLAAYKAPRAVVSVAVAPRAVNGKADYAAARALFDKARKA
jgi:acyl-CoA synthetase (AMP-forming)/AMP-acid ligase II